MSPAAFITSAPVIKEGVSSAYSLATGATGTFHAIRTHDKETIIENALHATRIAATLLETRAPIITTISALFSKLLSFEFKAPPTPLSPFAATVTGLIGCSLDAIIEIRGIIRCHRFVNRHFSSKELEQLTLKTLSYTNAMQDPVQKKERRIEIIRTIIPQLIPTPLTEKISSVFEEVVRNTPLIQGPAQRSSPNQIQRKMTYPELVKKIRLATWFTKLKKTQMTLIGIEPEKEEQIKQEALKRHPYNPRKRKALLVKLLTHEEEKKSLALNRITGASFAKKLKESIEPLLKNLLSENEAIADRALLDTKKLLQNTWLQAEKSIFIHTVGAVAAVISCVAFIITLSVACPVFIPLMLGIVGTIFYTARFVICDELLETEGVQFSLKSALYRAFVEPIKKHTIDRIKGPVSKSQDLFAKKLS